MSIWNDLDVYKVVCPNPQMQSLYKMGIVDSTYFDVNLCTKWVFVGCSK